MTAPDPVMFQVEVPLYVRHLGDVGTPPLTANQRLHWRDQARRVRMVREQVMIGAAPIRATPPIRHLTVTLHYRPGDNRRRDADNLWPTLKAACDALARGPRRDWVGLELVPDDTPEYMTKRAPVIHPGPGKRRLWLTVEVQR